jgi:hypothetical protein
MVQSPDILGTQSKTCQAYRRRSWASRVGRSRGHLSAGRDPVMVWLDPSQRPRYDQRSNGATR